MPDEGVLNPQFCRLDMDEEGKNTLLIEYLNSFSRTKMNFSKNAS